MRMVTYIFTIRMVLSRDTSLNTLIILAYYRKEKSMKGSDSLALIERENFDRWVEVHEKFGDSPMYTTLNEYIDNELIVLQMQIENLRLKLQDILNN